MDIYQAVKRQGEYPLLATKTKVAAVVTINLSKTPWIFVELCHGYDNFQLE